MKQFDTRKTQKYEVGKYISKNYKIFKNIQNIALYSGSIDYN